MADLSKIIRTDGKVSMDGATNAETYDSWAQNYDSDLRNWGYEAPARAAEILARHLDRETPRVLDCGCGTGMTGEAIRAAGLTGALTGLDMSTASLDIARTKNIYDRLDTADLNATLPIETSTVDGIMCVGVLTYVDHESLFNEWSRVLDASGVAVFTCREDHWESRGIRARVDALDKDGTLRKLSISDPMPYLPGHPDFGSAVEVIYGVLQAP